MEKEEIEEILLEPKTPPLIPKIRRKPTKKRKVKPFTRERSVSLEKEEFVEIMGSPKYITEEELQQLTPIKKKLTEPEMMLIRSLTPEDIGGREFKKYTKLFRSEPSQKTLERAKELGLSEPISVEYDVEEYEPIVVESKSPRYETEYKTPKKVKAFFTELLERAQTKEFEREEIRRELFKEEDEPLEEIGLEQNIRSYRPIEREYEPLEEEEIGLEQNVRSYRPIEKEYEQLEEKKGKKKVKIFGSTIQTSISKSGKIKVQTGKLKNYAEDRVARGNNLYTEISQNKKILSYYTNSNSYFNDKNEDILKMIEKLGNRWISYYEDKLKEGETIEKSQKYADNKCKERYKELRKVFDKKYPKNLEIKIIEKKYK